MEHYGNLLPLPADLNWGEPKPTVSAGSLTSEQQGILRQVVGQWISTC